MRWLLLLVLIACKADSLPRNTPSASACHADAECTVLMVGPDPKDPCCDATLTAAPVAKAHVAFVLEWRKTNCDRERACPPLALPGHPPACANEPRCKAGSCTNACP